MAKMTSWEQEKILEAMFLPPFIKNHFENIVVKEDLLLTYMCTQKQLFMCY